MILSTIKLTEIFKNIVWFQNIMLKTLKITAIIRILIQRVIPIRKTSTKMFVIWQPQIHNTENVRGNKSIFVILGLQFQIFLPPAANKFAKLDALSVFASFEHYASPRLLHLGVCVHYVCAFFTCIARLWRLIYALCMSFLCPLFM